MHSPYLPQRVVSLQPSVTVTLGNLGMLDRLVACTKWCIEVCPAVQQGGRTIVADSWTAKSQEILAAKPDLVIASVPYQLDAVAEILKAGVPFLGLSPHSLDDVFHDIATIARVMGAEDDGLRLVEDMRTKIAQLASTVEQKATNIAKPRVFCEEWGKPLIHSQQWVADLVAAAGGEFIGEPGRKTTVNQIMEADPDVIILSWCGAGDRVPLEKVIAQRSWQELRAVRNRDVYCIPDEFLNTPAFTLLQGLEAIAGILHPQLFPLLHTRARRIQTSAARPNSQ